MSRHKNDDTEHSLELQPVQIFDKSNSQTQNNGIISGVTNTNSILSTRPAVSRRATKRALKGKYSEIVIGIFAHGSVKKFENNKKKEEFLQLSSKTNYYNPFPITGCPLYSNYQDRFYTIHTLKKYYSYRNNKTKTKTKTKKAHLKILDKFKKNENYIENQGIYHSQQNVNYVGFFHPDKRLHSKMVKLSKQIYNKKTTDPKNIELQKQFIGNDFLHILQDKDYDLRQNGYGFKEQFSGIYVFHHTGGKLKRYYNTKLVSVDDDHDGVFKKRNFILSLTDFDYDTTLFEIMKSLHSHYDKVYIYDFSCNSYYNLIDNYPTRKKAIQNPLVQPAAAVRGESSNNKSELKSLYYDEYTDISSI